MPGVGQQFDFDRFPQALRGGMRVYPYGGVLSGLTIGTVTITTGTLTVPYTEGVVRLDGLKFSIAANASWTIADVPSGEISTYPLFVQPTRANPVVTTKPTYADAAPSGNAGNYKLYCVDMGDYYQMIDWYKYDGAGWVVHDPIFDAPSLDYGNLPHNEIVAAAVALNGEKMVYNKNASVPFLSQPAAHYARYDSSVHFATLTVDVAAGGTLNSFSVDYKNVELPM